MSLSYKVENGEIHVVLPDGSTCDVSDIDTRESWNEYMDSIEN